MKNMKNILLGLITLSLVLTWPANADTKNEKILKILEITNALQMGQQVHDTIFQQLAPLFPKEATPILLGISDAFKTDMFKDLIVSLYDKHFTESELDAMFTFYTSKEGKSIINKMPVVMQESMQVGNEFGKIQVRKIIEEMKNKGFEPEPI